MNGASYDELLVGGLAIIMSIVAVFIAAGPWDGPYQLRSISAVRRRYGKPVARGVWVAISVAAFTSGVAIIAGIRPNYAEQQQEIGRQGPGF